MIFRLITVASVLALAACGDSSGEAVTTNAVSSTAAPANPSLTQDQIGKCWVQAGLKGDLYKLLTPAEVQGISKVGGASKDQMKMFKACLAV